MKQAETEWYEQSKIQPPSGGCVLKQGPIGPQGLQGEPAAFGRLCVETRVNEARKAKMAPAAFGRLCVETVTKTRYNTP